MASVWKFDSARHRSVSLLWGAAKQTDAVTSPAVTDYPYDAKQRLEGTLTSTMPRDVAHDADQEIRACRFPTVEARLPQWSGET
jgi:hypothetical protein